MVRSYGGPLAVGPMARWVATHSLAVVQDLTTESSIEAHMARGVPVFLLLMPDDYEDSLGEVLKAFKAVAARVRTRAWRAPCVRARRGPHVCVAASTQLCLIPLCLLILLHHTCTCACSVYIHMYTLRARLLSTARCATPRAFAGAGSSVVCLWLQGHRALAAVRAVVGH